MKPKSGVLMYGVVLIGVLVVSILLTTISVATTVEEGQLDICNSSEIHTNTTYVQSAEFVLKDSYKQEEEIEIKLRNNAKEAIYYDASGCIGGLCPFSYNIIQKESGDKIKNYNLYLPVPTLFRIEKVEPGTTKVIDIWDQNTYYITNPEKRECEAMQVSPGEYIINFSYSTDPELKNKFSTIKEITICIGEEKTDSTTVTTSQEENETSPRIGVGVLEEETNGTTLIVTPQEENDIQILDENTSQMENQSITTGPYQLNNSRDTNESFDGANDRNISIPLGTITIQPGPSEGKDAFVNEYSPNTNYGSNHYLRVGCALTYPTYYDKVSFVQFSLSSIPSGSTITSATLDLYCDTTYGDPQYIRLYQLSSSWSESTVTWNDAPNYWTGEYTTAYVSGTGWKSWDATDHVQEWWNGQTTNCGFYLRHTTWDDEDQSIFRSSDYSSSSYRPKLVVTYTPSSKPDLIIEDIWTEPATFGPGDTVRLKWKVKNIGSVDAGSFRSKLYFDGTWISYYDHSGLSAGSSHTIYYDYTWPSDCTSHELKAIADTENTVDEENEGNNDKTKWFSADCGNPDINVLPNHLDFECSPTGSSSIDHPSIMIDTTKTSAIINVTFADLDINYDGKYHQVSSKGCDFVTETGAPMLPVKNFFILLPADATTVEGYNVSTDKVELEGEYFVEPVPIPEIAFDSGSVPSEDLAYNSLDPYPKDVFVVNGIYKFRGYRLLSVTFFAAQYDPSSHKLIQVNQTEVELRFSKIGGLLPNPLYRGLAEDEEAVKGMVENSDVASTYPLLGEKPLATYKYVIITSSDLVSAFEPLKNWKISKLGSAKIVTVSWITSTYSGVDTQEKIRNFIKDYYSNHGTEWVLLGGDVEIVPHRGCYGKVFSTSGWVIDENIPCDLYYSDLDGSWNADGDSIWGEVEDNVDLLWDVAVGRAPVNIATEATNFVNKARTYEQNPPPGYLMNAELIAYWLDASTNEAVLKDYIESNYLTTYTVTKDYEPYDGAGVDKITVMNHLNSGQGIVNHASHANSGSIPPLYIADVDSLSNGDKLFIFYTMGCLANKFDISDAISEHYINNADGGAVAFIGNSRYGWYWRGLPGDGTSDKYDKEFFKRLFDDGYTHIGETLAMSKTTYLGSSGSDGTYRWVQYCLNLLGDPEMTIHTSSENCKPLTVHNEGGADLIVSNIEIGYQSGEPTGWLDANPKSLTVSPSGSEPMTVCVDCTGLSPDDYHGWLNIRSNDPDEDPYTVTVTLCVNGPWEDDPSNPCKERRLTCSGTYEYRNKADGTICGHGEWEDDPANPCKERRGIQKCVSGTCTPSGEYEYRNKADGTICGHGEWEDDPANPCKERRGIQKCVSGTCTPSGEYEYRNKADGTICGHGEWEDDPANPCKERRGIQKCVSGTCTPSGEYEYRNKADGTICGHGEWEDDPANPCKERRGIQKCVSGTCTPSGEYEYRNKADGTICGHGEWEDDPANPCKERRGIQKCVSGTCTPSGEYEYQDKPDGTICGCTASNTLKKCNDGVCTDTGICDATTCGADVACDGKEPGDSCGGGICDLNCKCRGQVGEDIGIRYNNGWWEFKYGPVDEILNCQPADHWLMYGIGTGTPVVGDFNDDDIDGIGIRYNNGWWEFKYGPVDEILNCQPADHWLMYGIGTGTPVVGDFNDDNIDDIGIRYNNGWWEFKYGPVDEILNCQPADHWLMYGIGTGTPVVGDFNDDNIDDIGIRYNNGWWEFKYGPVDEILNCQPADHWLMYGIGTGTPLVCDFNDDNIDDIGIRYNKGWWEFKYGPVDEIPNCQPADHWLMYGIGTGTPVVGSFNP